MTEPVNLWKPITDLYKEEAEKKPSAEAENEQKLKELHESNLRKPWTQAKAPLGIRIFTWYYFVRAALSAILLFVIATFPQSYVSNLMSDSIGNALHLPGSKSAREARRKVIEREAQAYAVPENSIPDENPEFSPPAMHELVIGYLLFNLVVTVVVGFMWWNRFWFVRWVTMFYAGALIANAAIGFIAGVASGVGSQIAPAQMPALVLGLGINTIIFLYLSFGYGVKQWFEPAP